MSDKLKIKITEWEYEDQLPNMDYNLYQKLYRCSQVRDGVRVFPFVRINNQKYFLY
jgi:hypothetical protein